MNQPAISVIMAVHNGLAFISDAVESILRQSLTDLEFIVVDDGSSDGTGDWLRQRAQSDARLVVLRQSNQGLTKSLNRAIGRASGALIARMDGDDIALPNRFAVQKDYLDANPDVVMVGSEVMLITDDGISLGPRRHAQDHCEIRRRLLVGDGGALTHPAVMIRKSALDAVGGYDEEFVTAQDLDLFLRLSEFGRVANLDATLLLWRQHPSSVNRTRAGSWQSMKRMALRKCFERCSVDQIVNDFFPAPFDWSVPDNAFGLAQVAASNYETKGALRLLARAILHGEKPFSATCQAATLTATALVRRAKSMFGIVGS